MTPQQDQDAAPADAVPWAPSNMLASEGEQNGDGIRLSAGDMTGSMTGSNGGADAWWGGSGALGLEGVTPDGKVSLSPAEGPLPSNSEAARPGQRNADARLGEVSREGEARVCPKRRDGSDDAEGSGPSSRQARPAPNGEIRSWDTSIVGPCVQRSVAGTGAGVGGSGGGECLRDVEDANIGRVLAASDSCTLEVFPTMPFAAVDRPRDDPCWA